jgi:Ser/Thr protein kinase RdoA (MazF antagonist)
MRTRSRTLVKDAEATAEFSALTPDAVIDAIESAFDFSCTSTCRPLNSYINRVYDVGLDDGAHIIAKFYRPGRWSRDALQDELDFLTELNADEVPVVPPFPGRDGASLHEWQGTWFAVFPRKGGRALEEPSPDAWTYIGRLIARLHAVGARRAPRDRIHLHPRKATVAQLEYILKSGTVPPDFRDEYKATVSGLIERIAPLFEGVETLRIHGDLHFGNILSRPDEGYHLLDFDDMAVGPAVQDMWLILPDRLARARTEMESLLEGYETFMEFPRETMRLIEPLRAMRFIHFTAWCARQKADGGFARLAPDWGTREFWHQQIADLVTQMQEIEDAAKGKAD